VAAADVAAAAWWGLGADGEIDALRAAAEMGAQGVDPERPWSLRL
jgi:hypothetical protein